MPDVSGAVGATLPHMIARALSIRVIGLSLLVGIAAGVLVNQAAPTIPTMPVVWVVAAMVYLLAVLNEAQMIRCSACGKRVKMGSSTCHHCGYTAAV